jgi:hypothetical protein
MPGLPPKLVVTTYAPTRRVITIVLLVLVVAAASTDVRVRPLQRRVRRPAALKQRARMRPKSSQRGHDFRAARQGGAAGISTVGQTREREEVQRTIGDLQAQVARANQELAFFRGIVTQNANSAEVKIQQARMVATARPTNFRVPVTLVQPMKGPDTVVSGVVICPSMARLMASPGVRISRHCPAKSGVRYPITFRYLENIEEEITMPPGMKPEQLLVEVRSTGAAAAPVQQSYVWSVDPQ